MYIPFAIRIIIRRILVFNVTMHAYNMYRYIYTYIYCNNTTHHEHPPVLFNGTFLRICNFQNFTETIFTDAVNVLTNRLLYWRLILKNRENLVPRRLTISAVFLHLSCICTLLLSSPFSLKGRKDLTAPKFPSLVYKTTAISAIHNFSKFWRGGGIPCSSLPCMKP